MNKLELDKVMENFNYKQNSKYRYKNLEIYHSCYSYYTIVMGKTPYELAKLINSKYDNSKYHIRVNGNNDNKVPCGDVSYYHIDTIEGLTAFLLETATYYSKDNYYVGELKENLNTIYTRILKEINPRISVIDWMLDSNSRKKYFNSLLSMNSNLDFILRKKIMEFDNSINPFVNGQLEVDSYSFSVNGYKTDDSNSFTLYDDDENIFMTNIKEKDSFVVELKLVNEETGEIIIYHYYDNDGETIAIEEYKYDNSELNRLEYNLSNQSFGECYDEKHKDTNKDKKMIIECLDKYTKIARNAVENSVNKNREWVKTLSRKIN